MRGGGGGGEVESEAKRERLVSLQLARDGCSFLSCENRL